MVERVEKSEQEWKALLTPEQFKVARKEGTERAFSGHLWDEKRAGTYHCVCCKTPVFGSRSKYDSGTGWPSFWAPVAVDNVGTKTDRKLFAKRTEVHCAACDAHLGHVFDDGPPPTGQRYCLNSVALDFVVVEKAPGEHGVGR